MMTLPRGVATRAARAVAGAVLALCSLWQAHGAAQSTTQASTTRWRAGVTTMSVAVESWGQDCGPRPADSRTQGGGTVEVTQDGKRLTVRGAGHAVHTDKCWSRNPAMRRTSSTYRNGLWTTKCRTDKDDPREESGVYTMSRLGEGQLEYRDVSRYNWRLKDSDCIATITTVQKLLRVADETRAPPPEPAPEPATTEPDVESEPTDTDAPCLPGEPARLTLGPRSASIHVGSRQCFFVRVLDAEGCRVPNPRVTYGLRHSPALKARMERNCLQTAQTAAEAEGEYRVTASVATASGTLRSTATVQVRAADLSGLIAARLETGGVTGFLGDDGASAEPVAAAPATHVSSRPTEPITTDGGNRLWWATLVAAVGLLALLLLGRAARRRTAGAAAAQAERRRQEREAAQASEASDEPGPVVAASAVAPAAEAESEGTGLGAEPSGDDTAPDETWICPTCRRGYPSRRGTCPSCPSGQNRLLPYAEFAGRAAAAARTKVCNACGAQLAAESNFCGRCGSRDLRTSDDE